MKTSLHNIIVCILIFNSMSSIFAQDLRYGLEFNSFEMVQEKRTSLNLSPSKTFSFPNGFSLSFNLFFQSALKYNFGYVFRIIGRNNQHLDFLVTPEELNMIDSKDKVLAICSLSEVSNNYSSFFPIQTNLDIKNDLLNITIGEKVFSKKISSIEDFKEVSIIFGRCDHPLFQTNDVPKMIIKDVRINNIKGDMIYYWKLSKHVENGIYDELKKQFAKVENPKWLINDHAFWNKRISFTTYKNPQITYNPDKKNIVVANKKHFYTYNTNTHQLICDENSSGFPHSNSSNQMVYNPVDSTYYSYCFFNTDGRIVTAYDFTNKSWSNKSIWEFNSEYWHHNRFVSTKENCLYLFGGYGQHNYKDYVNKYSFETKKWEQLQYKNKESAPPPHYLGGLGVIDENTILLFGGYGSRSGSQSFSPQNYYDLYRISLPDLDAKKIWEMPAPTNHYVVANSMIVDTLNKCFYALCFPQNKYETFLFLTKFSIEKPEYEIVSNKIPFYFNDILSYADLFHNEITNELYAITFSSLPTDSLARVSIYSISYPPIAEASIYQSIDNKNSINFVMIGVGLFILLLIFIIICLRFFKKKKKNIEIEPFNESSDEELATIDQVSDRKKEQAIFLFGGFQVTDKNGSDISGKFSPMMKQLFLIILLNTLKEDSNGISSTKLDETLWPGKSRDSAVNNRSVMTSKIRQILENISYLNIESSNSRWIAKLGDEVYCDYCEALQLIRNMKKRSNRTKEDVMKLLKIVSFGELLPNLQTEWVDAFKASFSNELIDLLIDVSKQKEFAFSFPELINLADALLIHDVLNDDALRLKCRSLVKMGKNGLAKTTYDSFTKQYAILFGAPYGYAFDQIIS